MHSVLRNGVRRSTSGEVGTVFRTGWIATVSTPWTHPLSYPVIHAGLSANCDELVVNCTLSDDQTMDTDLREIVEC